MKHPIIEDLQWRYTSKKYDPSKKVSSKDLGILFEAMRLSASSINSQPWKFIVIESAKARQRMAQTFANKFEFNKTHIFDCSQIILFAHKHSYNREDYAKVIDQDIRVKRSSEQQREEAFAKFAFAELNTDEHGDSSAWTKAQLYLALGNTLHTLARLRIDATPMEGVDSELISEEFSAELNGYRCEVALAIGYRDQQQDYNAQLSKSRLDLDQILLRL